MDDFLFTGLFAPDQQLPGMIRIFNILVAMVASGMTGDQFVVAVQTDPVRIGF
jgi:hypothetical protein